MPNQNSTATVWNCPNYVGELFLVGANQTPFLNMVGGLNGGLQVNSWEHPVAQTWSLDAASQPAITEAASLTAPAPETWVRGQNKNVCQIFQRAVSISYAKQSNWGTLSGLPIAGVSQPVINERDFQIQAMLSQVAVDVDYTILNGVYNLAANATEANKMCGLIPAIATNVVANTPDTALTKDMISLLLRSMAASGARFSNMVILANAFQVEHISDIYGYAPMDRNIGGVAVKTVLTDFCTLSVVWDPNVPADTIVIFDATAINMVFLPVPGKGVIFYEELARTGAAESGQIYGQIGLAYGPEVYHGKITGLTSS